MPSLWPRLTPQQRAICELLCLGKTDAEIAAEIGVAKRTIKEYLARIYRMAGISPRDTAPKLPRICLIVALTYERHPELVPRPNTISVALTPEPNCIRRDAHYFDHTRPIFYNRKASMTEGAMTPLEKGLFRKKVA